MFSPATSRHPPDMTGQKVAVCQQWFHCLCAAGTSQFDQETHVPDGYELLVP